MKDNYFLILLVILSPIIIVSFGEVISLCGIYPILWIILLFSIAFVYGCCFGYKLGGPAAKRFFSKKWVFSRILIYIVLLVLLFAILNTLWFCNVSQIMLSSCIFVLNPFISYKVGYYIISKKRERIRRGHFKRKFP